MLYALRGKLNDRIHLLYGGETVGVISGFILGVTDDSDPSVSLLFTNLGLSHILAISGQHISLLAFGLLFLMRSLNITRERAYEMTMFLIPLYVGMTGLSPSAVGAFIMGEAGSCWLTISSFSGWFKFSCPRFSPYGIGQSLLYS